jgi:sodium/bile acid cotransporter 7
VPCSHKINFPLCCAALSGLSLKSEELKNAFKQVRFNIFVQTFNFFAVSPLVFGISRFLLHVGALDTALADGMTICSCLPTSISMVMALTVSGKGDEASAVFHSAFGNMVGVFLTPVMILMYIGATGTVDLATVFVKLTCRVINPIVVGQLLRKFYRPVSPFVAKHKLRLSKLSEWALVFIVYTVFCQTFTEKSDATIAQIFTMVGFIFLILVGIMILSWGLLRLGFKDQPKLQVMGLFGCTHKTVAMGVPLISAIYQGNPLVGLYTLPVLVWHPMQLVLGTMVTPRLAVYVDKEEARIAAEKIAGDDKAVPAERE